MAYRIFNRDYIIQNPEHKLHNTEYRLQKKKNHPDISTCNANFQQFVHLVLASEALSSKVLYMFREV